jgi:hypothetical protein
LAVATAVVANPVTPTESSEKTSLVIEKLSTSPVPPTITPSNHLVSDVAVPALSVQVSKEVSQSAENLLIDTEPSVHFSSYDTVFDENTKDISHIRYSPKDAEEETAPRLSFGNSFQPISSQDIEDIDGPSVPVSQRIATPSEDIDAPLGNTEDFEVLA